MVTVMVYSTSVVTSGLLITLPVLETNGELELNVIVASLKSFNTLLSQLQHVP